MISRSSSASSRREKPRLRTSSTGTSQNFADESSRSTWTCGGSFGSWLKKYTRYGPERRTVAIGAIYALKGCFAVGLAVQRCNGFMGGILLRGEPVSTYTNVVFIQLNDQVGATTDTTRGKVKEGVGNNSSRNQAGPAISARAHVGCAQRLYKAASGHPDQTGEICFFQSSGWYDSLAGSRTRCSISVRSRTRRLAAITAARPPSAVG